MQRNATGIMASSLAIGLLFQDLAALLKPAVFPFAVAAMMFALVRVDAAEVLAHIRKPGRVVAIIVGTMVLVPLALAGVLEFVDLGADLETGMLLMAAAPSLTSSPAYAIFLGLDAALAVVVSVPAMLVAPFLIPPVLIELAGIDIDLGLATFGIRLAVLVGISFGGAYAIRRLAGGDAIERKGYRVDALVVLTIWIFGIGVMDGVRGSIVEDPAKVISFAAVAVGWNVLMQVVGAIAAWRLGRVRALTVGLLTGYRNAILVLGAVATTGNADVILFVVVQQLPLYVMPAVSKPVVRRILAFRQRRER